MEYSAQLQFVRDLCNGMNISTHIAINPDDFIDSSIDLGLRQLIFNKNNYKALLHNSMSQAKSNTIYRFFDEYNCKYIFMRLPNTNDSTYFFIGPYLLEPPQKDLINQRLCHLKLSRECIEQIYKYYTHLPIIEDENILFTITHTLGNIIWGSPDAYTTEYIEYMILDNMTPISYSPAYENNEDSNLSLELLEQNYHNEKLLMEAVSQGKLHLVTAVASSVYNNGTEQRLSDSLRNRKNYLIILNTLLRKAVEQGGVHPLHIDKVSSSFAHEIESIHSINDSLHLQETMIRKYCLLVKNHSLKKYSYLVGKAITLITYDLTADLSLKNIAQQLNVNSTYLSSLFHKECNITLTNYVNKKRIEKAIHLLNTTNKLIQNISAECGIQDTNYFIKLFKKETGLTPVQYRSKIGNNS